MPYSGEERRKPVDAEEEIKGLLLQATDPIHKALALILLKVSDAVDQNTAVTHNIRVELAAHMVEEMATLNQQKGGMKIALYAVGAVQFFIATIIALAMHIASDKLADLQTLQYDMLQVKIEMAKHVEHHKQEEKYLKP